MNKYDSNYNGDFIDYVTYTGKKDNFVCGAILLTTTHAVVFILGMFIHHLLFK